MHAVTEVIACMDINGERRRYPGCSQRTMGESKQVIALVDAATQDRASDTEERAEKTKLDWQLPNLRIGHSLPFKDARRWRLYVSAGRGATSIGVEEPGLFSEPGLFLIRPDRTVYFASVQSMPFARPHFADILTAIDFVTVKSHPARGEIETVG
jgi:hypothetical protein